MAQGLDTGPSGNIRNPFSRPRTPNANPGQQMTPRGHSMFGRTNRMMRQPQAGLGGPIGSPTNPGLGGGGPNRDTGGPIGGGMGGPGDFNPLDTGPSSLPFDLESILNPSMMNPNMMANPMMNPNMMNPGMIQGMNPPRFGGNTGISGMMGGGGGLFDRYRRLQQPGQQPGLNY